MARGVLFCRAPDELAIHAFQLQADLQIAAKSIFGNFRDQRGGTAESGKRHCDIVG
jgi:hypothetical protein